MDYRVSAEALIETLGVWDSLITGRGKIHLIACGGTALTLLGYKESTKDIDFLVPRPAEYTRLVGFLKRAGYIQVTGGYGWKRPDEALIFDLYPGKKVYTTELLNSPLRKGGHRKIRAWKKIYLGVLNPIDLIISKMFRGTEVDIQDSLTLLAGEKVNFRILEKRYRETAKYEISEAKVLRNFDILKKRFERK